MAKKTKLKQQVQETRDLDELLLNWKTLNEGLHSLNEEECETLLEAEKQHGRRLGFMRRIYGRYNRLRTSREHRELAAIV